jgi:NAD(P)-dependent dehydrogenase (short-subunit alcohol dehydrogenase family)
MKDLAGKRVVVIGASSGMGRACALRAAELGAEIAVVARRRPALEAVIDEAGGGTIITADLRDPDDCGRIGKEAAAQLGGIDVALVTAAVARLRPLREHTAEDWLDTIGTNLIGTNLAVSGIVPHMSDKGIVGVVSSEAAGSPYYALGAYAASKSAMEDAMRAWRIEHPSVRFVTLIIGTCIPTEFSDHFDPDVLRAAFQMWAAQGKATADYMSAHEVADVVTRVFGTMLKNPSVGVEVLRLRPAGGIAASYDGVLAP